MQLKSVGVPPLLSTIPMAPLRKKVIILRICVLSFEKIMRTVYEDPIYRAGVEVAPVWELIENAAPSKKMHLDGIPNLSYSPVTRYLKDKNKTIISADDIEINE